MLLPESAAKMRFCPFGRGIAPLGDHTGKFASGINMAPTRFITHCQGSACMLWETHNVINLPQEHDCVHPKDQPEEDVKKCNTCHGTLKVKTTRQENIGFCGAAFDGPGQVALTELTAEVSKLVRVACKAANVTPKELEDMMIPQPPKEPTP